MSGSNFEPSQNQMQMLARDIVSIDDFLSHLTIPPVPVLNSSTKAERVAALNNKTVSQVKLLK